MDDETPEMEAITDEMREVMRAWIVDPENADLKRRYSELQAAYQRAFLALKRGGEPAMVQEATHQAYT
jgi:hypothetical protein